LARTGAAVGLQSFLHERYQPYHLQVFHLAVTALRKQPDGSAPLTSPELVDLFRASVPLARRQIADLAATSDQAAPIGGQLDASGVELNEAHLVGADLAWLTLRNVTCRSANLRSVHLQRASLDRADFSRSDLTGSDLSGAELTDTTFNRGILRGATLDSVTAVGCSFRQSDLVGGSWRGSLIRGVNFEGASLDSADLSGSTFRAIQRAGREFRSNPEAAASMQNANLLDAKGLTHEQLLTCKEKGAKWGSPPVGDRPATPRRASVAVALRNDRQLKIEASDLQFGEKATCLLVERDGNECLLGEGVVGETGAKTGTMVMDSVLPQDQPAGEYNVVVRGLVSGIEGKTPLTI